MTARKAGWALRAIGALAALALATTGVAYAAHGGGKHKRTRIVGVKGSAKGAAALAKTIMVDPSQLTAARFVVVPPHHDPAAIASAPHEALAAFPRFGPSFAILSSGCAHYATRPNNAEDTSCDDGGGVYRGTRDTTVLRLTLKVPKGASCLSVRFRFLSEEYPEFVGSQYNDAFIAELDKSTWSSAPGNPQISAPRDFARTTDGRLISVNGTGIAKVSPRNSRGTTYDAATNVLRASTRVTPGRHFLYLSIFDQGDRQYDSSVFIDKLTLDNSKPCKRGLAPDQH